MTDVCAFRKMLVAMDDEYHEVIISIYHPEFIADDHYESRVTFSILPRYNTKVKGADSFNAIENCISYVNAICKESDDPPFFWEENERFIGR